MRRNDVPTRGTYQNHHKHNVRDEIKAHLRDVMLREAGAKREELLGSTNASVTCPRRLTVRQPL